MSDESFELEPRRQNLANSLRSVLGPHRRVDDSHQWILTELLFGIGCLEKLVSGGFSVTFGEQIFPFAQLAFHSQSAGQSTDVFAVHASDKAHCAGGPRKDLNQQMEKWHGRSFLFADFPDDA